MIPKTLHAPLRGLIAIIIAMLIYKTLHQRFGFWIVLTVVVLLPSTTGATTSKAISRVVGTLFGVLTGLLIVTLLPYNIWAYAIILILSIFFSVYSLRFSYQNCMFAFGILFVAGLTYFLDHGDTAEAWNFVIPRIIDTGIGAVIVILVSYWFWPESSLSNLEKLTFNSIKALYDSFTDVLNMYAGVMPYAEANKSFPETYEKLNQLRSSYQETKHEISRFKPKKLEVIAIVNNFAVVSNNLVALYTSYPFLPDSQKQNSEIQRQFKLLADKLSALSDKTAKLDEKDKQALLKLHMTNDFIEMARSMRQIDDGAWISENISEFNLYSVLTNLRSIFISLDFILTAYTNLGVETTK